MEQEDYFWTEEVISFSETGENKDRLGTIMHKFISMEAENVTKCGIFKPNFLGDVDYLHRKGRRMKPWRKVPTVGNRRGCWPRRFRGQPRRTEALLKPEAINPSDTSHHSFNFLQQCSEVWEKKQSPTELQVIKRDMPTQKEGLCGSMGSI